MHYYIMPSLKFRDDIDYYKCVYDMHPEYILEEVSEFYNIPVEQIKKGVGRGKQEVVHARQICTHLLRELTNFDLKRIGDFLGGYDHTSVIFNNQQVMDAISTNESIKAQVEVLKNRLS